jgi:integrase
MIDGKRRTKVCRNKDEAKRWEAAQDGKTWALSESAITVFDWRELYLDYAKERFTDNTYEEKKYAFTWFQRACPDDLPVTEITPLHAQNAFTLRAKDVSGCRANRDRKNMSAAFSWYTKTYALDLPNPFLKAQKFAEERKPRYIPPEDDFWKAVDCALTQSQRAFCLVMLYTAARRGELLRLTWDDVDLAGGRVRLWTRKRSNGTLEPDWIPLVGPARDQLAFLPRESSGLVFPNKRGNKHTERNQLLKGMCRRAGVVRFGFHAIRHLSASILAREGVPLPIIQRILRHRNALTTSRYLNSLGLDLPELERVWENRFAHHVQIESPGGEEIRH